MAKYLLLKHYRRSSGPDPLPGRHEAAAAELSAAPGAGGEPICEWLEVRPFLSRHPETDA